MKRRRVRIINKTCWRTADLRRFVDRIAADELNPEKRRHCTIKFVPARQQRGCSGHAALGGSWSQVNVPTKLDVFSAPYKIELAAVIAHEIAHNHGHKGERWMRASTRYGRGEATNKFYAWTAELPVERKAVKAKVRATGVEHAAQERAKVERKIVEWERREKRAKTALRKYRQKLRYYDRRIAAINSPKAVE